VLPTLLVLWTKYARVDVSLQPPAEVVTGGDGDAEADVSDA
jgi:hypothetical protein